MVIRGHWSPVSASGLRDQRGTGDAPASVAVDPGCDCEEQTNQENDDNDDHADDTTASSVTRSSPPGADFELARVCRRVPRWSYDSKSTLRSLLHAVPEPDRAIIGGWRVSDSTVQNARSLHHFATTSSVT